jgi:hypothetical protein
MAHRPAAQAPEYRSRLVVAAQALPVANVHGSAGGGSVHHESVSISMSTICSITAMVAHRRFAHHSIQLLPEYFRSL